MGQWDNRFREAHDYAGWHGFMTGWPNFHQADYGDGVVHGTLFLRGGVADWRDVPRSDYGVFQIEDIPAMMRAANDYAVGNGYEAGIPNFHQANHGNDVVYGTFLIKHGNTHFLDVPAAELGVWDRADVPAMMQAANDYAASHAYAAAFPTFHEANYGQGLVFGLRLFPPGVTIWRDVPADLLHKYSDPSMPLAVVLCRPSDVAAWTHTRKRWEEFFAPNGTDPSNVCTYWRTLSYGQYDPDGTVIFDWLDIGHTQAEINTFSGQQQRHKLAGWGAQAAVRASINLGNFGQVVFGYNINTDHGSVGGNRVVLAYEDTRPFEPTFMFHEVGHALGLGHSSSQISGTYGDRFDIMSAMNVWSFTDPQGRRAGPGAAAINLENLGWLHRSRVWRSWASTPQSITLAALNRPDIDEFLAARLSAGSVFYIEFRQDSGWDDGLPGPRVVIHVRNSGNAPEILGGEPNPAGALDAGEELQLPGASIPIVVRVEGIDIEASKATVRVWALPLGGYRSVSLTSLVFNPCSEDWQDEHVTIRNDTAKDVTLQGWKLSNLVGHTFTINTATPLAPGHNLRVWTGSGTDSTKDVYMGCASSIWSNNGATAALIDASGSRISTYAYGNGG